MLGQFFHSNHNLQVCVLSCNWYAVFINLFLAQTRVLSLVCTGIVEQFEISKDVKLGWPIVFILFVFVPPLVLSSITISFSWYLSRY